MRTLLGIGSSSSRFSNDPRGGCAHAWPALAAVMVAVSCDPHSCLHLLDGVKILRHGGSEGVDGCVQGCGEGSGVKARGGWEEI